MNNVYVTDGVDSSKGLDIGAIVSNALSKAWYGHTVMEVVSLAFALEAMIDAAIVKALIKDDESTAEFAIEKVIAPMGRNRKSELLRKLFDHYSVAEGTQICDRIGSVFALRDKVAHSVAIKIGDDLAIDLVSARGGVMTAYQVNSGEVEGTLADGQQALADLTPYATAGGTGFGNTPSV